VGEYSGKCLLVARGYISAETSSILIVVGRQDTGDLDAQIRGSRHAWDIRLISVDSLLRLLRVKESVEGPATEKQIADLLIPREYTRVDGIIDLVFAAATDATDDEGPGESESEADDTVSAPAGKKFTPVNFHEACAKRIGAALKVELLRRSKAMFSTPDDHIVVMRHFARI
jgi:hypothetical protein